MLLPQKTASLSSPLRHGGILENEAESAELEALCCTPRGHVFVGARVNKDEFTSEDRAKAVCIVPRNRKAAAFFGAVRRECADDGVSAAS
jgi:hypothetical protein